MNSTLNISNSHSNLSYIYQKACHGAVKGAKVGASVVAFAATYEAFIFILENVSRAAGIQPRWTIYEADCQLEQFRELSTCTNPPIFSSFTSFTVCTIGTTTLDGMTSGAIKAVYDIAKNTIALSHSE